MQRNSLEKLLFENKRYNLLPRMHEIFSRNAQFLAIIIHQIPSSNKFLEKGNAMRVGIYARVSSNDQTTENQLIPLRDHCKRMQYLDVNEYVDNGFSGKNDKRPAFEKLLYDMRLGNIDCVVCYKLDRIGRSLKHLLRISQELPALLAQG